MLVVGDGLACMSRDRVKIALGRQFSGKDEEYSGHDVAHLWRYWVARLSEACCCRALVMSHMTCKGRLVRALPFIC